MQDIVNTDEMKAKIESAVKDISSSRLASAPTPAENTSQPKKFTSGCICAMSAVVSPIPQPISNTKGACLPKTSFVLINSCLYSTAYRGSNSSSARFCAWLIWPRRRVKLRICFFLNASISSAVRIFLSVILEKNGRLGPFDCVKLERMRGIEPPS